MKPRKLRKPRIRDLPPEEQAGRWWASAYVRNSCLTDEGLLAVLPKLHREYARKAEPTAGVRRYLKTMSRTLKQRGLEERAAAVLVAARLKGNL